MSNTPNSEEPMLINPSYEPDDGTSVYRVILREGGFARKSRIPNQEHSKSCMFFKDLDSSTGPQSYL